MIWKLTADFVLVFHILWVTAVLLLPVWAVRFPRARVAHAVLLGLTLGVMVTGFYCPLTVMESSLRMRYDPSSAYAQGFLAHHLSRLASLEVPVAQVNAAITGWALLWVSVYLFLWRREKRQGPAR